MHLKTRNVNTAFQTLVSGIYTGSIPTVHRSSRAGDVLQVEEPVIVTYSHPRERVLFNKKRDAPCFFTLFESLWMLAGRNDVAPLAYYNSQIADIASDDGKTFNGAYGYRWRNGYGGQEAGGDGPYPYTEDRRVDQLSIIIDQLRRKPESRRCVLQMWEVESDLLKIDETKDCCCNLSVLFSIRNEPFDCLDPTDPAVFMPASDRVYRYLDMTVYNRSNDMIWGALGANVVHFSFLQEYVANCLGVEVGSYNQVSNNLHVYTERWEPEKWLAEYQPIRLCTACHPNPIYIEAESGCCGKCGQVSRFLRSPNVDDYKQARSCLYDRGSVDYISLVQDQARFDKECAAFIDCIDGDFEEPFLRDVAQPMMAAFRRHKRRSYRDNEGALNLIERVKAEDWKIAGRNWLLKRCEGWEKKGMPGYGMQQEMISEGTGEVIPPIQEGE